MRRVLTGKWLAVHLGALLLMAVFLGLAYWQLLRAEGGNGRSFGYALEWPVFAVILTFLWVKAIRDELRKTPEQIRVEAEAARAVAPPVDDGLPESLRRNRKPLPAVSEEDDAELAAYNRYLADLHARAEQHH